LKSYIFTKHELEILKTFLESNVRLDGFRDLKYRISKHHKRIQEHHKLLVEALEKMKITG